MDIRELFDGEMHEIFPKEWRPVDRKIVDWAPTEGRSHLSIETPELNWVVADLTPSEERMYGVEGGWSTIACMLQEVSRALGGRPVCYQKGRRYYFQHKIEEE